MESTSKAPVVGLVVPFAPDSDNAGMLPFLEAVARGVREHDHDHDLLLVTSADGPEHLRRIDDRGLVDAVVLMEVDEDDDGALPGRVLPHPEALAGVLAALGDRGLVPGVHLDVVAQCPDAVAARLSPPLTNTSQEPEDVSRHAVEAVSRGLADPRESPAVELVPPRLTRRSNTSARDRL